MRVLTICMLLLIATGCRPNVSVKFREVHQPDAVADSASSDDAATGAEEAAEEPAEGTEEEMTVPDESSLGEVLKMVQDGSAILVDVRSDDEWNESHFEAAKHIPINKINEDATKALAGIKKDQVVFLH